MQNMAVVHVVWFSLFRRMLLFQKNNKNKSNRKMAARSPFSERPVLFVALFLVSSLAFLVRFQSSSISAYSQQQNPYLIVAGPTDDSIFSRPPENDHHSLYMPPSKLALTLGDLPGYTGWARPFYTLAGLFEPPILLHPPGLVGHNVTVRVQCRADLNENTNNNPDHHPCHRGGSLFYARAYGEAILPGRIHDYRNGTYDVSIFPLDAGQYFLEVVLAFSNPPPLEDFPLKKGVEEPAFEGYLLPGFPMTLHVAPPQIQYLTQSKSRVPICLAKDLVENTTENAVENGRWVVAEKAVARPSTKRTNTKPSSLAGYQAGVYSLGMRMDYKPRNCALLEEDDLPMAFQCMKNIKKRKKLHVIYIGDSNLRMQEEYFVSFLDEIKFHYGSETSSNNFLLPINTTRIMLYGGMNETLANVSSALNDLRRTRDSKTQYFIIFNSGLHDITKRCARPKRKSTRIPPALDSCSEDYGGSLTKLAQLVLEFPAKLRVFQTTTAGWMKYGNFGFAWPPDTVQTLPRDPNFVQHLNEVAWKVLRGNPAMANKIQIMDAYWLTLARPDHREVNKVNFIGKHLVHCGPEILSTLTRKWIMMILQFLCGEGYRDELSSS
jgi:hypothetical protein